MRVMYNVQLEISPQHGACIFPVTRRWLKGEEYGFLIRHYFAYSKILKVHELCDQHHPHMVYKQPKHGALYFIRGLHLQDFGFPRVRIPMGVKPTKLKSEEQADERFVEEGIAIREIAEEPTS